MADETNGRQGENPDAPVLGIPSLQRAPRTDLYGPERTVWMRSIRGHTINGKLQEEGSVYLMSEDQVENIEKVLKFAVRDTPPDRPVDTPDTIPVVEEAATVTEPVTNSNTNESLVPKRRTTRVVKPPRP